MTTPALIENLRRDEGEPGTDRPALRAYRDTVGVWTIAFGHTAGVKEGDTCTDDQAEAWLAADAAEALRGLDRDIAWWRTLDPIRQDVLAEMAFNLGLPRLLGFTAMLAAARRGDWLQASAQMLSSRWATQVGARAMRLADTMKNGAPARP